MPNCAVRSCKNDSKNPRTKNSGVSFHLFPKDDNIKAKWIDAVQREDEWFPTPYTTLCSEHFEDNYIDCSKRRRCLSNGAIPTLKLGGINSEEEIEQIEQEISRPDAPVNVRKRSASPSIASVKYRKPNDEQNSANVEFETTLILKVETEEGERYPSTENLDKNSYDEKFIKCRVCLTNCPNPDGDLFSFSDNVTVNYKQISLLDCLKIVLCKKVSLDDRFPSRVCTKCVNRIINAYQLIDEYDKNQQIMEEMYGRNDDPSEFKTEEAFENENESVSSVSDKLTASGTHILEDNITNPTESQEGEEAVNSTPSENQLVQQEFNSELQIVSVNSMNPESTVSLNTDLIGRPRPKLATREDAEKNMDISTCENCCSAYIATEELSQQQEQLYRKVLRCKICERHFGNERILKNHMKQHNLVNSKSTSKKKVIMKS